VFKLIILDPKTHIILWALDEHVTMQGKLKEHDKEFDQGITNLVGYLKAITGSAAPAAK
jgi:hypothetical protein